MVAQPDDADPEEFRQIVNNRLARHVVATFYPIVVVPRETNPLGYLFLSQY